MIAALPSTAAVEPAGSTSRTTDGVRDVEDHADRARDRRSRRQHRLLSLAGARAVRAVKHNVGPGTTHSMGHA